MKIKLLLLPLALFIFSCGSENDISEESSSHETDQTDDVVENEETEEVETASGEPFLANTDVIRYDNSAVPTFETYPFNDVVEFVFPAEPVYEITEYDYVNHNFSELYEGTIYAIKISDYTNVDQELDDSYLQNICHNSEYEILGASDVTNETIENSNGVKGYYSTYTYDSGDHIYNEDLITMNVGRLVLYFKVTSRPKFESQPKLEYLINSVKAL